MNAAETKSLGIWTATERERLLMHVAKLPSPRRVAESLPEICLLALINAERDRFNQYRLMQAYRGTDAARELVAAGVVEIRGVHIGNFGMLVRREAIRMKLDGELD